MRHKRIDVVFNADKGHKTWNEAIKAVMNGESIVYCRFIPPTRNKCYCNKFYKELNKQGIDDIRFGECSVSGFRSDSYTIYK